jgi:hypothetical protein
MSQRNLASNEDWGDANEELGNIGAGVIAPLVCGRQCLCLSAEKRRLYLRCFLKLLSGGLPLVDFLSDLSATKDFYEDDEVGEADPGRLWAKISTTILVFSAFANLFFFWYQGDIKKGGDNNDDNAFVRSSFWLNVAVGFVLTVLGMRVEAMVLVMIYKALCTGKDEKALEQTGRLGDGGSPDGGSDNSAVSLGKLLEYVFESCGEIWLQSYAAAFLYYRGKKLPASLITSLVISLFVAAEGITSTYCKYLEDEGELWIKSGKLVKTAGVVYIASFLVMRFAVLSCMFLHFGKYGCAFVATSLALRFGIGVYFEDAWAFSREKAPFFYAILGAPVTFFFPLGKKKGGACVGAVDTFCLLEISAGEIANVQNALFSPHACCNLGLHLLESLVAAVLLTTLPSQDGRPHVPTADVLCFVAGGAGAALFARCLLYLAAVRYKNQVIGFEASLSRAISVRVATRQEEEPVAAQDTYWSSWGKYLTVDGTKVTQSAGKNVWGKVLAMGGPVMTKGQHAWDLKLDSSSSATDLNIGVVSSTANPNDTIEYGKPTSYTICVMNNELYGAEKGKSELAIGSVGPGDTVRVRLNLDDGTLAFDANGSLWHPGFTNVKGPVVRAVEIISQGRAIDLVVTTEEESKKKDHSTAGTSTDTNIFVEASETACQAIERQAEDGSGSSGYSADLPPIAIDQIEESLP